MSTSDHSRTPLELLEAQTQLLDNIYRLQEQIVQQQVRLDQVLTKGIECILLEQSKQNKFLRNISAAAILFTILTIISIAIGFCAGLSLY